MYTIEVIKEFLGWCSIINISVLIFSTLFIIIGRKIALNIHKKLFILNDEYLERAYFQYLAQYKILIIVFNIVPYIALSLMN